MQGLRRFEISPWSGNVYSKWMKPEQIIGCWQTEMGNGFATNPDWLPQTWFQDLGWALVHDGNRKDKYRDYFFTSTRLDHDTAFTGTARHHVGPTGIRSVR